MKVVGTKTYTPRNRAKGFVSWRKYISEQLKEKKVKYLTLFILLMVCGEVKPQFNLKKEIPSMVAFAFAGAFEGSAETVKWHYDEFEARFPEANEEYFNPEISWRNKYANGTPESGEKHFGSTTFLAWSTDYYHLARTSRNAFVLAGILITPKQKMNWKGYVLKALCYSISYQAGFHLTYSLIFR